MVVFIPDKEFVVLSFDLDSIMLSLRLVQKTRASGFVDNNLLMWLLLQFL